MSFKNKLFQKSSFKRTVFFVLADILIVGGSCWLGFFLRFDGQIPGQYHVMIKGFIVLAIIFTLFFFILEHLYSVSWSFVSIREILKILRATIISFAVVGTTLFILKDHPVFRGFPRSIIFISGLITFLLVSFLRFSKRIYLQSLKNGLKKKSGQPTLIIGAGEAGEQLIRHINSSSQTLYNPRGFIDDNPMKQGVIIHGIKVLGTIKHLPEIIKKYQITQVIMAMPTAPRKTIKKTIDLCRQNGVQKIKIIPSTAEILAEKVSLSHLREISIEDLLGRKKVEIDTQAIKQYITDKKVLITGAAGSIGAELCAQVCKFKPQQLICLDQSETGTFYLEKQLNQDYPEINKKFLISDITNQEKIDRIWQENEPEVVFHAAAYKHVPLMENNPDEAIRNNVFGTLNTAQASLKNKVEKFVMVSTDKAINPTSVMGASKRVCEMICVWLNKGGDSPHSGTVPETKFCAVRFGNVLGSQGSVVPVFEKQIQKGGPVEVTHPEMKRYFMVTAEACLLIMQAGATSQGGEVFVLDMGQPIKIVDLAREMIKLAGYQPDVDIPIVFTGIRPGEKLFEEIMTDQEKPTRHEKIFRAQLTKVDEEKLTKSLEEFKRALAQNDQAAIIKILKGLVPIQ